MFPRPVPFVVWGGGLFCVGRVYARHHFETDYCYHKSVSSTVLNADENFVVRVLESCGDVAVVGDVGFELWAAFMRAVTLFAGKARIPVGECLGCAWLWARTHPKQVATAWNHGQAGGVVLRVRGRLGECFTDYKHHEQEVCVDWLGGW